MSELRAPAAGHVPVVAALTVFLAFAADRLGGLLFDGVPDASIPAR